MKVGPQADAFGKFLVTQLRDQAIEHFDDLAAGHYKSPALLPLQRQLAGLDRETVSIIRRCVVNAVDSGIGHFLFGLQEEHDAGKDVAVLIDGRYQTKDGTQGSIWGRASVGSNDFSTQSLGLSLQANF